MDVALAAWLLGLEKPAQIERDPLRGALYENLLIMEVVKNLLNHGKEPQLYFFRDSKGNEVDLLVSAAGRSFTAIEIKSAATFQPDFIKGIDVFRQSVGENINVHSLVWYICCWFHRTIYDGNINNKAKIAISFVEGRASKRRQPIAFK